MKFRTEVKPLINENLISHQSKILLFGSCFAENIGDKLLKSDFDVKINPFGIAFNPMSILKQINGSPVEINHMIGAGDNVMSFDYHSKYNGKTIADFEAKISKDQKIVKREIESADIVGFTFGTAWTYLLKQTNQTIANCQKQPASLFTKQLLNIDSILEQYTLFIQELLLSNPNVKIILTVSPVRHLKDGLIENNRSKAILLLLCQNLANLFKENVIYYPSYEIVMDDLRDYRFFEKDLLHPNEMAIDYIYTHFQNSFFSENTKTINVMIDKYNRLLNHKNINSSKNNLKENKTKLKELQNRIVALKLS
ncbi:MAG: GSCFA domain-containing protein [Crocinitomicaceae bacterium]